jgi:hypothetical protein
MTGNNLQYKVFFITVLLLAFLLSGVNAQYENKSTQDIKTEAKGYFDQGKYREALDHYRLLLKRYPKDGTFCYFCGLSQLKLNEDLPQAIKDLETASSKTGIPTDVYFYLGEAFSRNYQFQAAIRAYDLFMKNAAKTEIKELSPQRRSEMAANALKLSGSYPEAGVVGAWFFSFRDSSEVAAISVDGSRLGLKPPSLLPSPAGNEDIVNFMFLPGDSAGMEVYYSGHGKNRKSGSDIFTAKYSGDGKFTGTESPGELNSAFDEVLPCYDEHSGRLYFASKGFNSIGGYDIFISEYDSTKQAWKSPVNAGFPVNSPYDELMAFPGRDSGSLNVVSNRQFPDSIPVLYTILFTGNRVSQAGSDLSKLRNDVQFAGTVPVFRTVPDITQKDLSVSETLQKTENVPSDIFPFSLDPEFGNSLRKALGEQFLADSLASLATDGRIRAGGIANPEERWSLQRKIIEWEKESAFHQREAEKAYLALKSNSVAPKVEVQLPDTGTVKLQEPVLADTIVYMVPENEPRVADTITVAQNPGIKDTVIAEIPVQEIVKIPVPAEDTIVKTQKQLINEFRVLNTSPYNSRNPFPREIKLPQGAYYKIQLAVLGKTPEWGTFHGLSPVTWEDIPEKNLKKFYAGRFSEYLNAKSALETVRRKGFPEAFIVGWFDGTKMSVTKVYDLEKADTKQAQ